MNMAVQVQPTTTLADVQYRWDADTDILTVTLAPPPGRGGASGSVEVQGSDGSWLTLDVVDGCIGGLQVAVWPTVKKRRSLTPPAVSEAADAALADAADPSDIVAFEVSAPVAAEADDGEHSFHFLLGRGRPARTVRIARDVLLELDDRLHVYGVWLLNVPPSPHSTA